MTQAYLVLDDGTIFPGNAWGATGASIGDLEIYTGMTGYQGALSAEESKGKIILMTAVHIGNVGTNNETTKPFQAAGLIVREVARRPSNWKSTGTLETALHDHSVIGICNVDTRAVTIHLRETARPMRAAIISGDALPARSTYSQDAAHAEVIAMATQILSISREAH